MAVRIQVLFALACILLSVAVNAQWPWSWGGNNGGNNGGRDEDDGWTWSGGQQQPQQSPRNQPWGQQPQQPQNQPWGQPQQPPQNQPWGQPQQPPQNQPWGQQPQQPPQNQPWGQQPARPSPQPGNNPPRVTVTVTNYGKGQPKQTAPPKQNPTPQPKNNPPPPQTPQGPRWTAPSVWGPQRTSPFGATPTGPQTIPTTTTEAPKEPVPFIAVCGRNRYVEDDISNAIIGGCYYKNKTQTVNNSGYPKQFANSQRFNFGSIQGPYWEFPLISSAAYIGGPAGADRVVFNEKCWLAGEITETGAGSRGYTECKEEF